LALALGLVEGELVGSCSTITDWASVLVMVMMTIAMVREWMDIDKGTDGGMYEV
jgi:hypothetical protein